MSLEFDSKTHTYRKDGVIVPSVTQILAANGLTDFSMVEKEKLDYAIALGNAVHYGSELWENGTLDPESVDEPVKKRLDQWLLFLESARRCGLLKGHKLVEQEMYSKLGFAGKPDRVFWEQTSSKSANVIIIDIKTGAKSHAAELQTAGYEILVGEEIGQVKKTKRFCVYLKDGSFSIEEHKSPVDKQIFLSCLNVYNFKRKMKVVY